MISLWRVIRQIASHPGDTRSWRGIAAWLLREETLTLRKSLRYAVPLYFLSVCAVATGLLSQAIPANISRWCCVLVLLSLSVEAGALLLSLLRFLSDMVFLPAEQRAGELVRLNADVETELKQICTSGGEINPTRLKNLAIHALKNDALAGEALKRLATFGAFAARLIAAFVLATMALVFLEPTGGPDKDVFQSVHMSLGLPAVAERSLYLNLVLISTVGLGDMAPLAAPARILTDIEIVTSALLVLFGVNMVVGLVLEGSATAWAQRRDLVSEYLERRIQDARDLEGSPPEVGENGKT